MDVDRGDLLDIWFGKECYVDMELGRVQELASVADRVQMTDVVSALEEIVCGNLNVCTCGDIMNAAVNLVKGRWRMLRGNSQWSDSRS